MPNKQITDLDPLVGGMDDTYNFWTQVDGGGAGSSFQMAWSKLFIAKNAAGGSGLSGSGLILQTGAGDGNGDGGNLELNSGAGYDGGYISLTTGDGSGFAGGRMNLYTGNGEYEGGDIYLVAGQGTGTSAYGGNIIALAGVGSYEGGYVRIAGGDGPGTGGDVRIYAGNGTPDGNLMLFRIPESTAVSNVVYVDNITRGLKLKA